MHELNENINKEISKRNYEEGPSRNSGGEERKENEERRAIYGKAEHWNTPICIMGVPESKETEKKAENLFKNNDQNFLKSEKKNGYKNPRNWKNSN